MSGPTFGRKVGLGGEDAQREQWVDELGRVKVERLDALAASVRRLSGQVRTCLELVTASAETQADTREQIKAIGEEVKACSEALAAVFPPPGDPASAGSSSGKSRGRGR